MEDREGRGRGRRDGGDGGYCYVCCWYLLWYGGERGDRGERGGRVVLVYVVMVVVRDDNVDGFLRLFVG